MYDFEDSDLAVIIGSGAGGGTLANELCQRGKKVVLLEAGPHLTAKDFVNDDWAARKSSLASGQATARCLSIRSPVMSRAAKARFPAW